MSTNGFAEIFEFGLFLKQARSKLKKKNRTRIAIELKMSKSSVIKWENGEAFPLWEKLPVIAEKYQVDLEELIEKFTLSKNARQEETQSIHSAKKESRKNSGHVLDECFSGKIESTHMSRRLNPRFRIWEDNE